MWKKKKENLTIIYFPEISNIYATLLGTQQKSSEEHKELGVTDAEVTGWSPTPKRASHPRGYWLDLMELSWLLLLQTLELSLSEERKRSFPLTTEDGAPLTVCRSPRCLHKGLPVHQETRTHTVSCSPRHNSNGCRPFCWELSLSLSLSSLD